jgi:hypothetical protein
MQKSLKKQNEEEESLDIRHLLIMGETESEGLVLRTDGDF